MTEPTPKPYIERPAKPEPSYAPIYCAALYPELATIAREHGYALAVHGSLARDFDLIAVPWTETAADPSAVVNAFCSTFHIRRVTNVPSPAKHGREVWTLSIGFGECFLDLSFMPRRQYAPDPLGDALNSGDGSYRP